MSSTSLSIDDIKPLKVERPFDINAYDIDVMGIVSNIVYVRWFEDMRKLLLDVHLPYTGLLDDGISPVLSRTEVNYMKPLTMYDQPHGVLWLAEMSKSRYDVSGNEFAFTSTRKPRKTS